MIGRKGRDLVSIPVPQLDVPHFRFGRNQGGVGQGDGEVGQPIARGDQDGEGGNQAGSDPAGHILEVEVSLEELAQILGDELELPKIEPKGQSNISQEKKHATTASDALVPNRCGTFVVLMSKRCGGRFPKGAMTPGVPASSPFATIPAIARGKRSKSPRQMLRLFT